MLCPATLRRAASVALRGNKTRSLVVPSKANRSAAPVHRRLFCDKAKPNPAQAEAQTDAIVLTPYEKVAAGTQVGMWVGIAGLATVCGYFIVRELFPSRMSPNSLFGEASDIILQNDMVLQRLGAPIRCYGRDYGGNKEGRRNFIEHVELNDKEGNKTRLRIKFNLQGPNGKAQAWAETNAGMKKGEYVYLIVQTYTGEIIKIQDNRQILQAETEEERDALKRLLGGN
ncbi:transmembrane protein [Achlya hypogyna]|uniref:Mitochondrial import inner membrane translocase subunit Tim21 n=1 Tax=Achlya hypogyna TaxID=1202772 RepID=A0A1V9ZGH6_ACHHY|nr:transmembrane protein [Achlya hypogyna]